MKSLPGTEAFTKVVGLITAMALTVATLSYANDSAVESAAGGLKLRKERSVLMEKERLHISKNLIRVEYEFRNESNRAVSSEVGFPIPRYGYVFDDTAGRRDFADFKAWVNGQPVAITREVRAFIGTKEVTADLMQAGITIENFGGYDPSEEPGSSYQVLNLTPSVRKHLQTIGAIAGDKNNSSRFKPLWEVQIMYHWQQEFPPGETVRVKHEYRPVVGVRPSQLGELRQEFSDACLDDRTIEKIVQRMGKAPLSSDYLGAVWVKYILTTANTWKTPIKDFEMTVDAGPGRDGDADRSVLSFCWDGAVERSAQRITVKRTNFIPEKDVTVYFFRP